MTKATIRMAPAVKPEDLRKEYFFGLDAESIRKGLLTHLEFTLAELPKQVDSEWEPYLSLALTVRDRLIERWSRTQDTYYANDAKRLYYMSLEFLMGRALANSLISLGIDNETAKAVRELGYDLEELATRSGMPVSVMVVLDDWRHAYWTRWLPWSCPPTVMVSATNTACFISALSTATKWKFPMPGCAMATLGKLLVLMIFSA